MGNGQADSANRQALADLKTTALSFLRKRKSRRWCGNTSNGSGDVIRLHPYHVPHFSTKMEGLQHGNRRKTWKKLPHYCCGRHRPQRQTNPSPLRLDPGRKADAPPGGERAEPTSGPLRGTGQDRLHSPGRKRALCRLRRAVHEGLWSFEPKAYHPVKL